MMSERPMQLEPNVIHVWSTELTITQEQENAKLSLLSGDERERALRFHFPIHRQRYIAARSFLRQILSNYFNTDPTEFIFSYGENEKPHLFIPENTPFQFNLSHSHEMAVYAFTLDHAIGVDIEKIQPDYNLDVAQRYFSTRENADMLRLSPQDRIPCFYRIWSRKEAIIKAIGKGLSMPLPSFSVSASNITEVIVLEDNQHFTLAPILIDAGYQSAVATKQSVKKIIYWNYFNQAPEMDKVSVL
jgi:4'-phosphopantetheinyl transferase